MEKKSSLILIGLIGMSFVLSKVQIVSVIFWNNLFLISLLLLIISGFIYMIGMGTFDLIFKSFRIFYKKSSKLESYVSEEEYRDSAAEKGKLNSPLISSSILKYSVVFMFVSLTVSYLFYY